MSCASVMKMQDAPRVLVVDDEPDMLELVDDVIGQRGVRTLHATSLAEAQGILSRETIELLVTDVKLPDGDGTELLDTLQASQPRARAIVMTGAPSVDRAISAIRFGATDFLPKPFSADLLAERIGRALLIQARAARVEQRLTRLRAALRRLNESRKVVSRKVDLLCNDLVTAYGEVSRELNHVRLHERFRNHLGQARDLEQLLCHAMDWLLREIGYTNIAVWLNADENEMHLGAYMKYTIAGDETLVQAMRSGLLPRVEREGTVALNGDAVRTQLPPEARAHLSGQSVLGAVCRYLGESLGMIVLFRDEQTGFSAEHVALMESAAPIFAVALASMVKADGPGGSPEGPFADPKSPADQESDWWKRGEAPPY